MLWPLFLGRLFGKETLQAGYARFGSAKQFLLTNASESYLEFGELLD